MQKLLLLLLSLVLLAGCGSGGESVEVKDQGRFSSDDSGGSSDDVDADNSPPVISDLEDGATIMNTTSEAMEFSLTDPDGDTVTCTGSIVQWSENQTLVTNDNIVLGGTAPDCTVTITPENSQVGSATINLKADDDKESETFTFTFTVTTDGAYKVAFIDQPTDVQVNQSISPSITVVIQDAAGQIVDSETSDVTLAISTDGAGSGTSLGGTTTIAAVGGTATFSNITLDQVGTGFILTATSGTLTSATSSSFDVTAAPVAQLEISDGATYDFGQYPLTSSQDKTFTLTNNGAATANSITSSSLSSPFQFKGGSFPGTGGDCTSSLNAGNNCTFVVTYTPSAKVTSDDTVDIDYHDGAGATNTTRDVSGTGVDPAELSFSDSPVYDFGSVSTGSIGEKTFTITNNGEYIASSMSGSGLSAPFEFKGGSYPGTGGDCATTLAASGSCSIVVTYSPTLAVATTQTAQIDYNDGLAAQNITNDVTGIGDSSISITVTSPVDASYINIGNDSATFSVTGTCSENAQDVTVVIDGGDVATAQVSQCNGSTFSVTFDSTTLGETAHTLAAKIEDSFGNELTSASINVTRDVSPPAAPTNEAVASAWIQSTAAAPTFNWSSSVATDLSHHEVALGSSSGGQELVTYITSGASESHSFTGLSMSECTNYYASVRAIDVAGNPSTVVTANTFMADVSGPSGITNLSVDSAQASTTEAGATVWSSTTDNCSLSHYEIAVGTSSGGEQTLAYKDIALVSSYHPQNGVDGVTISLVGAQDYYTSIKAVDSAGNESIITSSSWQIPSYIVTDLIEPVDGTYGEGGEILFQLTFTGDVDVTNTPRIALDIGGNTRYADYYQGTGTDGLEFRYVVQAGDTDADGITIPSQSIELNGGTIKGTGNETVQLGFSAQLGDLSAVLVDTAITPPDQVTGVVTAPTTESDELGVTWDQPNDNGNTITEYSVQYRKQGDAAWINVSPNPTTNSTTIGSLLSSTTYEIRVAANNGVLGAYSSISTAEVFNIMDLDPIAWLDGSDPNGNGTLPSNDDKIATWVEKTGEASNATEADTAKQPVFKTNVQNGLGAVRFDNLDRGLSGTFTRSTGTDLTIVIIGQYDSGQTDKCMFEFIGGGSARAFFIDRRYASNNFYSPALTKGQFNMWVIENAGANATVKEGSTEIYNGGLTFNTDFTGVGTYYLGDDSTGGNRMYGYIGEILIFDKALSPTELSQLESYVQNKWGL